MVRPFFALFASAIVLLPMASHADAGDPPKESQAIVINDQEQIQILNPSLKERQTLKLRLSNGLEAFLISDPGAPHAAAALAVNAGGWQDPDDFPGTAHFLEHMLFLGTSKYPQESEYSKFVNENEGQTNAYTYYDHTCFMFSIQHPGFEEALDRFSWFFKEPLFNPSGVDREMHAVDQEFAKNVENDYWRNFSVHSELANKAHPYSRFYAGNLSTLQRISQSDLKKWYHEHYSANLMHLVIYSNLPIEKLKAMALDKFQDIENRNLKPLTESLPTLSSENEGQIVFIAPVKDLRQLVMTWELPAKFAHMWGMGPDKLVGQVLGHEGSKSLLAKLKTEKLAEGLYVNGDELGPDNFHFNLTVTLTEKGIKNYKDVISYCFAAIANLKAKGVPDYIFDEIQKMDMISYQYQDRKEPFEYVASMARMMLSEKLETFPMRSLIIQKHKPEDIQEFLGAMTPEKCHYTLIADPIFSGVTPSLTEKWTGAHYAMQPLPAKLVKSWAEIAPIAEIDLPEPNPFIPENMSLLHASTSKVLVAPFKKLVEEEGAVIYYAADTQYQMPQTVWKFDIKTPKIKLDQAASLVLGDLYAKAVKEELNAYGYDALLAGLGYNIERKDNGITVTLSGYNDKALILFKEIVKKLQNSHTTEEDFEAYKEEVARGYKNFSKEMPLKQVNEILQTALYKDYIVESEKAKALRKITFKDFETFSTEVFHQSYVQGMLYGNINEDTALAAWRDLKLALASSAYSKSSQTKKEVISLPAINGPFFVMDKTKQRGSALILLLQLGPFSYKKRAINEIFNSAIAEPFYNQLRTQQQTGYIVYNTSAEYESQLFSLYYLQTDSHDTRDLLARFELAIEGFLQTLAIPQVAQPQFETIRQALIQRFSQPPKSQADMAERLYALAYVYDGQFDRVEKTIEALKSLTYGEYMELAMQYFGKSNKQRLAVLMKGEMSPKTLIYTQIRTTAQLKKISDYLSSDESMKSDLAPTTQAMKAK